MRNADFGAVARLLRRASDLPSRLRGLSHVPYTQSSAAQALLNSRATAPTVPWIGYK